MVSDSEPRYRLVDANGNVVGALYAQGDGTLAIQEGTSGSDNEVTVDTDGTFNAPAVSTNDAAIKGRQFSNRGKTISVPDDVSLSNLGDELPVHYEGTITVNVSGDHSTEQATIEPVIEAEDPGGPLIIEGDRATPSNAKVGGLLIGGSVGKRPVIARGLQYEDVHSKADGNTSLQVQGGAGSVVVSDSNFNNGQGTASRAITVYSGRLLLKGNIDVGNDDYTRFIFAKSQAEVFDQTGASGGDLTGSVSQVLFRNAGASMFVVDKSTSAFGWGEFESPRGHFEIFDSNNQFSDNESLGERNVLTTDAFGAIRKADGGEFSTNTKPLIDVNARGGLVSVAGRGGPNNARFVDLVHVCAYNSASVVNSEANADADGRTYSVNGQDLELTMAGGTYTVTAVMETFDTTISL